MDGGFGCYFRPSVSRLHPFFESKVKFKENQKMDPKVSSFSSKLKRVHPKEKKFNVFFQWTMFSIKKWRRKECDVLFFSKIIWSLMIHTQSTNENRRGRRRSLSLTPSEIKYKWLSLLRRRLLRMSVIFTFFNSFLASILVEQVFFSIKKAIVQNNFWSSMHQTHTKGTRRDNYLLFIFIICQIRYVEHKVFFVKKWSEILYCFYEFYFLCSSKFNFFRSLFHQAKFLERKWTAGRKL